MPARLDTKAADFEQAFSRFLALKRDTEEDVSRTVQEILREVRARGDAALLELGERFDGVRREAADLRVPPEEIAMARGAAEPGVLEALEEAKRRIADHHLRQRPEDLDYVDGTGIRLGHRWTPIDAVGLYVPGGKAAYPSSVLMNAVPAKAAGVERLVMVTPMPAGRPNELVLAAAAVAGVDEIYRVGGAQAVAALAYGTDTIQPVDKIVGPGNAYVTEAKRQVFGTVGIDSIAGPSEILVVADAANDPAWIAADLLSQAEHDEVAQAILITDDARFAGRVEEAIARHLASLPRAAIAGESWETYGAVILVRSLEEAPHLVNAVAPEHLELAVAAPEALMKDIRHAGAIFLGRFTSEVIGDYLAGPSHVLPTGRSARFSSGLSVLDFMKRSSIMECSEEGLRRLTEPAVTLASAEGLDAHALSLTLRRAKGGEAA